MTNPPPPGWQSPHPGPQNRFGPEQPQYGFAQTPPPAGWVPRPSPHKNRGLRFLIIGGVVLLVVALSVAATLLFTRSSDEIATPAPDGSISDMASAEDTGPVTVITEDPTCAPWRPIISTLASQQRQGWESRDYSRSRSEWTADEQRLYEAVAKAMLGAADRTAALAKLTTHRVMRELYEQSIAYWRAYADSIPNYRPADNFLAITASDTSDAITSICGAIDNGAAAARGPLVAPQQSATTDEEEGRTNSPEKFIGEKDQAFCSQWSDLVKKFEQDTAEWRNWDALTPASEWDPRHQSIMTNATPVFENFADDMASLARSGNNAIVRDFAELSAQYFRAYVQAIPTYDVNDSYLSSVGTLGYLSIFNACASAEV